MDKRTAGFTRINFLQNLGGFSLVELLIVVSVVTILAVVGTVVYGEAIKNSRDQQRMRDLQTIAQAMELYRSDNQTYPDSYFSVSCNSTETRLQKYLENLPQDPKCSANPPYSYGYASFQNNGSPCYNQEQEHCGFFVVCAKREGLGTAAGPNECNNLNCGINNCDMGLKSR